MTPDQLAKLTARRRDLHQMPEVSGEEQKTAAKVVEYLSEFKPDQIVTGLGGHGVAAVYKGAEPGPTIAIRCELDGLPIQEISDLPYASRYAGKGHLCGHDGHMTMVLGVAEALAQDWPGKGRVVLIFQPAEETGKGAKAFRADPRFQDLSPDVLFSLHNLPGLAFGLVELCSGPANCASRGLRIALTGKTSHAAAPQDGASPAGAIAALLTALSELGRGGALDDAYALTTVTHAQLGAATFGVAPGEGEIWVTLRTVTDARMDQLMTEAEALTNQVARAYGLQVSMSYDDVFEACTNDAMAVDCLAKACKSQSVPCQISETPQRFSEDFGQFGKSAKAAMFWLGAGEDHPQLHNPDYDFPDQLIPIGTGIFLEAIKLALRSEPT